LLQYLEITPPSNSPPTPRQDLVVGALLLVLQGISKFAQDIRAIARAY
jgi:hypothetical protein